MLGLNFFGNDFITPDGGGSIIADQYLSILQQHRPKLAWDEASAEHVLEYVAQGERHVVYYPTLMSLQQRLELAYEFGVGVSIWDLGQGLEFFMDLF